MRTLLLLTILLAEVLHVHGQRYWSMDSCVQYALHNNLDIQHQAFDIQLKEQDIRIAKSERLPGVSGYTNLYSNFGRSQDVFGTIQRNDNLNSNMGITADIVLYNFGALRHKIRKTQTDKEVAALERQLLERQLTIKVMQGYLNVLLKQALVQTRDSSVLHAQRIFDRAKRTNAVGTTALTDVYEAKMALAREQQRLEAAKIDSDRALLHLAQLMMLEDERLLHIAPEQTADLLALTADFESADVLTTVYQAHPALMRYDTLARGLDIERLLARSANYPYLKGSTSIGSTYFNPLKIKNSENFFYQTRDNFAQQVALTASFPIFNKGQTKIKLKQIDLSKEQLMIERDREQQNIRTEIQQLLFDLRSNKQQYRTAEQLVLYAEQSMLLTQKSYEAGKSSIFDYNNSRNQYNQAKSDWVQARYNTLFSYKLLQFQITGQYTSE